MLGEKTGLQRVKRCVERARKIRHLGGCKNSPLKTQRTVLEVDFLHPGYPKGGHCSHTAACNAWKMPPLPPPQAEWEGSASTKGIQPGDSLLPPGVKSMPAFDLRVALHFLQECRQNLENSLQQMPRVQLPATARKTTRAIFCLLMSSGRLRPGQPGKALQFPKNGDECVHSEPVLCFRTTSSPVHGSKMQIEIPGSRSKSL